MNHPLFPAVSQTSGDTAGRVAAAFELMFPTSEAETPMNSFALRSFELERRRAAIEAAERAIAEMLQAAEAAKADMGERGTGIVITRRFKQDNQEPYIDCRCPDEATCLEFQRRYALRRPPFMLPCE